MQNYELISKFAAKIKIEMKLITSISVSALALSLITCSENNNESSSAATGQDYSAFTGSNAVASAATIDSLALEADFITPEQGVGVLVGLSEIVKNEQAGGSSSKKLEYMRKYIDTYDILVGRSDEFKTAIDEARSTARVDLPAIFEQYRDILNGEADGSVIEGEEGGGTTSAETSAPTAAKSDSTAAAQKPAAAPARPDSVG